MFGVNIAIIGNNFGKKVHLPVFQFISGVNIIGIYSRNWQEIISNPFIDAVSIALPPAIAYEVIKSAIQNNKHIFAEKPFVANLSQAYNLKKMLSDNIIHALDFEMCENRVIKRAKQMMDLKLLGNVQQFECVWRSSTDYQQHAWKLDICQGGGVLNNFGSHVFYLLEWLFSDKLQSIESSLHINISYNTKIQAHIKFPDFSGNVLLDANSHFLSNFALTIKCQEGNLILTNHHPNMSNFSLNIQLNNQMPEIIDQEHNTDPDGRINLVRSLAERFIQSIQNNQPMHPNFNDGVRIQEINDMLFNQVSQ